ncbi:MAG: septum formation family protein [Actinomycetota bacterium]|nr:septum formation family protein [Actinomycetota bacterium]
MLLHRLATVVCLTAVAVTACTVDDPAQEAGPSPAATPTTAPPTATEQPFPEDRACYRLTVELAVAPTADQPPVDCSKRHTSITFAVGRLDNVARGHLLAIDSQRVRDAVAEICTEKFAEFAGGSEEAQRLSMLRTVWFTPTVEESDQGAEWYRCDAIAVSADDRLAPLSGRLAGVLGSPEGRDRYGMCGTTAPDDPTFERVICSEPHRWRAIATVDLGPGRYPGVDAVRSRGQTPCEDAGASAADDVLDYEWGYEWPTKDQWQQGQTFGRCWAPD